MADNDTTVRDLLLIGVIGGVGIYAARTLLKPGPTGPTGPVIIPPLPQIPTKDDDNPAPPVIVMPQLPNGGGVPPINITLPNGETYSPPLNIGEGGPKPPDPVKPDPVNPSDPEVEEPPKQDLPPPQNIPEWNTDVGTWTARSLNLSGANGGVLQHVEKWATEKEKRMDANPDRKGTLWEAYYGLTSSPAAVKLGNLLKGKH